MRDSTLAEPRLRPSSFKVVGFPGSIFNKSDRGKSREKRQHQGDIYHCRDVDRGGKQQ